MQEDALQHTAHIKMKYRMPGEKKHRGLLVLFILIIILIIYLLYKYPEIIDYVRGALGL